MRLLDAHAKLLTLKQEVLRTSDAAACLDVTVAHASHILRRLSKAGFFLPLMRGKWACHATMDPLVLPEYLTAPAPSYVSLQSALYYHGMISQIPDTIYAVSLARTCRYKTAIATVSIHHMQPDFFFGFEVVPQSKIRMATPEKALLDFLYLSTVRSLLFSALPELEIPSTFRKGEALSMIDKIPSLQRRTIVRDKLQEHLQRSS